MTQEEKAAYAAAWKKRNQERIKQYQRFYRLNLRPTKAQKPEVVLDLKKKAKSELTQIENELLALDTLMLQEGHSINEFEFVVSRRNALLVRIQAMKQHINRDKYQPSIAILR